MKRLVPASVLTVLSLAGPLHADDWKTVDGNTYRNVKVVSHDDGFVTIMDGEGGARLMLTELPPALRAQFGFDPVKANACVVATLAAEAQTKAAIDDQRRQQDWAVSPQNVAHTDQSQITTAAPPAAGPALPPAAPSPALATTSAPPKAPTVDVMQNEAKIAEDQQALQDAEIDLRDAQREVAAAYRGPFQPEGTHASSDGSFHPDYVGNTPRDRIADLTDRQEKLKTEIKTLQAQDAAAAQSQSVSTTGTGQ